MPNITTIGNRGGKPTTLPSTAATGVVVLSAHAEANTPNTGDLPVGYKTTMFQLVPGDMSAGSVRIEGTLDANTAAGTAAVPIWDPIPAPATEAAYQWSNPLVNASGQRLLACDKPFIAYRAVTSNDWVGTTAALIVFASP